MFYIEQMLPDLRQKGLNMQSGTPATFQNTPYFSGGFNYAGVITALTANTTLTAAQSGGIFLLNAAAGFTVTLPKTVVGLTYTFIVQTSVTSNAYEVKTGDTTYLIGLVQSAASSGGAVDQWVGDGTSHIGVKMNGSTTGGLQGSQFSVTAVTSGLWQADGQLAGSGTLATPFSTT